jgi:hypothetical protein
MPKIEFESEWLKLGTNVLEGDNIRFLDCGEFNSEKNAWEFRVGVIRGEKKIDEKKFTLNRSNATEVIKVYGDNSDNWVDKEMKVNKIKVRNPQSNALVDGIFLSIPETK